jgi:hypothetical protein
MIATPATARPRPTLEDRIRMLKPAEPREAPTGYAIREFLVEEIGRSHPVGKTFATFPEAVEGWFLLGVARCGITAIAERRVQVATAEAEAVYVEEMASTWDFERRAWTPWKGC